MNRVEIARGTENVKSQAVAKRVGFTREGVVRQAEYINDHYVDHVIYEMLAADWVGRGDEPLRENPRDENQ
jgi:ribosomal-protein-serine acetyltransferase